MTPSLPPITLGQRTSPLLYLYPFAHLEPAITRILEHDEKNDLQMIGVAIQKSFSLSNVFFTYITPEATDQAFFVWPQSGAARLSQTKRLRNQLYHIHVKPGFTNKLPVQVDQLSGEVTYIFVSLSIGLPTLTN